MRYAVLALAVMLAGCVTDDARVRAAADAQQRQTQAAIAECNKRLPPNDPKIAVARMRCGNAAISLSRSMVPYPDLFDSLLAYRLVVAEQIEKGQVTPLQGDDLIQRRVSEVAAEEQRRILANQAVAAQNTAAAAAIEAAEASTRPVTCGKAWTTVICY